MELAPHVEGFKDIGGNWVNEEGNLIGFVSTREGQPGNLFVWDRATGTVWQATSEEKGFIVDLRWRFEFDGNNALLMDLKNSLKPLEFSVPEGYRIVNATVGLLPDFPSTTPIVVP